MNGRALYAGLGLALLPWMCLLAASGEWNWVALDAAEAAGLVTTGLAAGALARSAALATAGLLLLDAALDTATATGPGLTQAWLMALLIELPLAVSCLLTAARANARPARPVTGRLGVRLAA
ncbi:hypothetical protein [Streptacidiphilus monticola]|uniref:DUF4345 domain-containing protein n=1 Tax=Streptacidiphilus monticola TaxID=2161674 RepID=A0ABW1G8Y3_9ACTN